MRITELLKMIAETAGSTAKKDILAEQNTELLTEIFDYTYGGRKYFVKKYSVSNEGSLTLDEPTAWESVKEMLNKLASKIVSGNEALALIDKVVSRFTVEDQEVIQHIIEGNLKCGVTLKTFEAATGTISEATSNALPVALAINLDKVKGVNPIDGTFYASRKLDGSRCICKIKSNGDVMFLSRTNKEFLTLDNLIMPMRDLFSNQNQYDELIFDGECCIVDENGDEHFDWIMKEISRKNHTIPNPCYNIFDMLTPDEYYGRVQSPNFTERLARMKSLFDKLEYPYNEIKLLKQERITSQEDFDRWSQYVEDGNWEGFMLRKDAPFKGERTKDLLKVKKFMDAEYTVVDIETGQMIYAEDGNKNFDVVTAIIIEHKGNRVGVGSGLSKDQRIDWFQHPEHILSKTVTIQYFEETKNSKDNSLSLRFPVLKAVYDNGRTF